MFSYAAYACTFTNVSIAQIIHTWDVLYIEQGSGSKAYKELCRVTNGKTAKDDKDFLQETFTKFLRTQGITESLHKYRNVPVMNYSVDMVKY